MEKHSKTNLAKNVDFEQGAIDKRQAKRFKKKKETKKRFFHKKIHFFYQKLLMLPPCRPIQKQFEICGTFKKGLEAMLQAGLAVSLSKHCIESMVE